MWQSRTCLAAILFCGVQISPTLATAQAERSRYDIPAQALDVTLRLISLSAGKSIVAPAEILAGRQAPPLVGRYTVDEAMGLLLAGSGLKASRVGASYVIATDTDQSGSESPARDVVVTGSRIRGAAVASQTIVIGADRVRDEGQATLAEAAQTLPQNFGGGQNPGVGLNVPAGSGVNIGSGSSFNLRGIGSDATLTLLNGRRLTYSSSRQSVDLSAIPLGIVDRVEIVADGASAIYGSDAVAGVANIVLLRDTDRLQAGARLGRSTDGGGFEQTYGGTGGARWDNGGAIIAYEYGDTAAIRSDDRSYARSRPGLDLYPALERHNLAASAHQQIGSKVELGIDALYNHRESTTTFPLNAAGNRAISRGENPSQASSFLIAPRVSTGLGDAWRAELSGSYGEDRTRYESNTFTGDRRVSSVGGCYCNDVRSVEFSSDGPIFSLPGGPARLALGAGYRNVGFDNFRGTGNVQNFTVRQRSHYLYGEANLPVVRNIEGGGIRELTATAALRYERYPGVDSVLTPKFGLLFSPSKPLSFRASWGKSFRAPTLYQRFQPQIVAAFPAGVFGGRGLPTGATVLYLSGGREDLRPERATSWSVGTVLKPSLLPGARLEISYFHTDYRDRIVSPIGFISQALSNTIYGDQITTAPTAASLQAIVAGAGQFINGTGSAYDPTRVVAVINNANTNAGRQRLQGVDVLAALSRSLGRGSGTITATANASYLESEQQLTPLQPTIALAGTLFNPPHLRARGTLGWSGNGLTATAIYSRIGGVRDTRSSPPLRIAGMNTLDLTLRYRIEPSRSVFGGLDVTVTAQNVLNDKPTSISTSLFYDTPYDSTNYSPRGRFVALGISKTW